MLLGSCLSSALHPRRQSIATGVLPASALHFHSAPVTFSFFISAGAAVEKAMAELGKAIE